MVNAKTCLSCFSVCFVILLIVGLSLFGASFKVIDYNQAALRKNKFSVQIDQTSIYFSGRHFIGITGDFIIYDTTWQTIVFSKGSTSDSGFISAKTIESASVDLEITLMYRLKPEFLYSLYEKYPGLNQKTYMIQSAKQAIQQATNTFQLVDFFQNRELVSSTFAYNVSSIFKSQYSAEVTLFLLKQIQFADTFEQQYLKAAILLRQQETSKNQKALQIKIGEIATLTSEAAKNVSQILTNATAQATAIMAEGAAQGDALIIEAQLEAYDDLNEVFTDPNNLLRFLFYDEAAQSPNGTTYTGFSDTITFNFQ